MPVKPAGAGAVEWKAGIDEEGTVTASRETGRRSIASNRRARHDYTILKTYEAGIVLVGNEVKSLRSGHASLVGAFVQEHDGELMWTAPVILEALIPGRMQSHASTAEVPGGAA